MTREQYRRWYEWLANPANQERQIRGDYIQPGKDNQFQCCGMGAFYLANGIPVRWDDEMRDWQFFRNGDWHQITMPNFGLPYSIYQGVVQVNDEHRYTFKQISEMLKTSEGVAFKEIEDSNKVW